MKCQSFINAKRLIKMFTMPVMREMVKKVKTREIEYFESFILIWLGRSSKQQNSIVILWWAPTPNSLNKHKREI